MGLLSGGFCGDDLGWGIKVSRPHWMGEVGSISNEMLLCDCVACCDKCSTIRQQSDMVCKHQFEQHLTTSSSFREKNFDAIQLNIASGRHCR